MIEGKFKPRKYQIEGARLIQKHKGRVLLADDMGLGKTVQVCMWLSKRPDALPSVVVCPAAVKEHWSRTFEKVAEGTSQVLYGKRPEYADLHITDPDIYIINYEILQYWKEFLLEKKYRTFVLDEIQRCGNRKTIVTNTSISLSQAAVHVMGLSGTPLQNRPADLWPGLHMIWPHRYSNFWRFGHAYCGARHNVWGWNFKGASNIDLLHKELKKYGMIRRTQTEVLKELPKQNREVIVLPMSLYQKYYRAAISFLRWLADEEGMDAAIRASKAEQLVRLGHLRRLAAECKMEAAAEWINDWLESNPSEKIVLFTTTRLIVELLQQRVKSKTCVIDGSTKDKNAIVKQFQTDKKCRVLIGNIRAAGTGLDGLQRVCSTAAFVELADRPVDHTQAERRLRRIGSRKHKPNWFYYLVAAGTIEEDYCKLLQAKQKIVTQVLDGEEGSLLLDDLDIHEQLVSKLQETTMKKIDGKIWADKRHKSKQRWAEMDNEE